MSQTSALAFRFAFLAACFIAQLGQAGEKPAAAQSNSDPPAATKLMRPAPYEVFQREGFDPVLASPHQEGGPRLGSARVPVIGTLSLPPNATYEARVVALDGAWGTGTDWAKIAPAVDGNQWSATIDVPAGGWYRLEVRGQLDRKTIHLASVEPFGVGEVFVVAGQSYAAGANDEVLKVEEPHGRVAAFDTATKTWRTAHDPQPNQGEGGTIWPALGNTLAPILKVPVAFVNVASGGTSSRQWMPGETLYQNLAAAGEEIGRFRAVLWQQGESDVIEKVSTEKYVENLTMIRSSLAKEWKFEPVWLLAKSTLHPTVYNDPAGEGRIRTAIDRLYATPGFRPGPDTDILDGENRGGIGTRRHFTGIGQRRAGLLWFAAILTELNRRPDAGAPPH